MLGADVTENQQYRLVGIEITFTCMRNVHSRLLAVAQYALLEANGKVNGIGENSHPFPSQTLAPDDRQTDDRRTDRR